MGGADKVKRQHDGGRLTVRERIDRLLDPAASTRSARIAGKAEYDGDERPASTSRRPTSCSAAARIDGRPVVVGGDDFTVRGGAADATIREKQVMSEQMANELRLPLIRLVEGTGGGGSVKTIETTGRTNVPGDPALGMGRRQTWAPCRWSALGLGSVAGLGAARLVTSHYSVMVEGHLADVHRRPAGGGAPRART